MIELGFSGKLGDKILKCCEEAQSYYKENAFISSVESRYNWLESRLQFFQKHMLQKELKEVKEVIENLKIKKKLSSSSFEWRDAEEASNFGAILNSAVEKMTNYLKLFNASEAEIE
jgi:hypothetical protein